MSEQRIVRDGLGIGESPRWHDGRLWVSDWGARAIRRTARATFRCSLPPPWNDIVADGRGNAYVNCAGFDFPGGEFAPGLVAIATADGDVREVAGGLAFPNGMAITPDERTLIVAESYGRGLTALAIPPDGTLSERRGLA